MFTVKWIAENGAEMIYSAKGDVSYTPPETVAPAPITSCSTEQPEPVRTLLVRDMKRPTVSFYLADGDVRCTIDSGRVYVMNGHGRTVADYLISTKEFPHGLAPRQAA